MGLNSAVAPMANKIELALYMGIYRNHEVILDNNYGNRYNYSYDSFMYINELQLIYKCI